MKVLIRDLKCVKELTIQSSDLAKGNNIMETTLKQLQTDKQLNNKIGHLENVVGDHEQHKRKYCLLLHCIEENKWENTGKLVREIINKELGLNLNILSKSNFVPSFFVFSDFDECFPEQE